MNNYELLNRFLKVEFGHEDFIKFTEIDKQFLERYKINRNETEKKILSELMGKNFTTVIDYYRNNPFVENAKRRLQYLYDRFRTLCVRNSVDLIIPFNQSFSEFLNWWCSYIEEYGNKCYYCGIEENISKQAVMNGLLVSKKPAWKSGALQIDKKDPAGGYHKSNCVLACMLCNNAKSDMISESEFQNFFAETIKNYWKHIKTKLI